MNNNDSLHILIQSMSKSEKKHFKLSQLGSKKSNYIKLFDAIDKQEIYDEASLRKKFRAEKFVEYLSVLKNQLQEKILQALREIHSDKNLHIGVFNKLTDASTLYQRGLHDLAHKQLDKALEIIKELELYELAPIYMRKRIVFWQEEQFIKTAEQSITELENETVNFLEAIVTDVKMQGAMQRFNKISKTTGFINNENDIQQYAAILSEPILQDVNNLKTSRAVYNYYFVKSLFHLSHKNADACIENGIASLEVVRKKAEQSDYFLEPYIIALGNNITYCINFRKYNYYQSFKAQLEEIESKIDKVPIAGINRRIEALRANELQYYLLSGEETSELKIIELLEKLKHIDASNNTLHTATLLLYIAYAHLNLKQFDTCIEYLDKLDNKIRGGEAHILDLPSTIIRVICHFEMGNLEYLESLFRNSKRALEKHNAYNPSVSLFFQFIKKKVRFYTDKKKLKEIKKEFLQALETEPHIDWSAKMYFNFQSWLK